MAFPAISTGVYGYPAGPAAELAVATVRACAVAPVTEVVLVAFHDADLERFNRLLG